jgi:hypothetical protein
MEGTAMLINIPLLMEVAKTNKVDVVTLSKMVQTVGTEYAALKNRQIADIEFGKIIKLVCSSYTYNDLFGHLPYETAVGQYFARSKKEKAKLDVVMLTSSKLRVRVGVCTFSEYAVVKTRARSSLGSREVVTLRHHANIRPKGTRYDDQLMPSRVVEKQVLAWLETHRKG